MPSHRASYSEPQNDRELVRQMLAEHYPSLSGISKPGLILTLTFLIYVIVPYFYGTRGLQWTVSSGLCCQLGHYLILCVVPVSYTHLDVYKRQLQIRAVCKKLFDCV